MREQLILLPGWGFDARALSPLAEQLARLVPWLTVDIAPLPALVQEDAWLDELHLRLPETCWLGGWSLGGMLAAQLAARRGRACRGLVTLASNASFQTRSGWPAAMPGPVFRDFCQAFELDAQEALKRFVLLCSRGGFDPKTLARQLQVSQLQVPTKVLAAGLRLLAQLDNRHALQKYAGPQLHLLGEHDVLVPAAAAGALDRLLPAARIQLFRRASHALPLEYPDDVAEILAGFFGAHCG